MIARHARSHSGRVRSVTVLLPIALLLGACSSADSSEPEGAGEADTTAVTGEGAAGEPDAVEGATGEPPGPARDELREAIATWYFEEGPSETQARADCVADAMLDSATVAELADLGVTVETIDELFLGPLGKNQAFVDRVVDCVARFP